MTAHDLRRGYALYVADNSVHYNLATTTQNITAASFTPTTVGTNPPLPPGWVPRYCLGFNGAARHKLPIPTVGNVLYVGSTTSFTIDTVVFTVAGIIGERRYSRGG
jgi:hypothetical protein